MFAPGGLRCAIHRSPLPAHSTPLPARRETASAPIPQNSSDVCGWSGWPTYKLECCSCRGGLLDGGSNAATTDCPVVTIVHDGDLVRDIDAARDRSSILVLSAICLLVMAPRARRLSAGDLCNCRELGTWRGHIHCIWSCVLGSAVIDAHEDEAEGR